MSFATPEDLEKYHVRHVYNQIAPHFVGSTHKAWPKVEEFLLSLPAGSLIADVGCGTGKYLGLAPESFILGSDSCLKLGEIAVKRGHNVVACDNQNLPFRDNCFDAVISVGVIHHFASARRRIKALEELYRILQPGGKMLVYVWALEQDERKFDGQDVLVPYTHYQRNKARRTLSTPVMSRLQSQVRERGSPRSSALSWQSQRSFSLDSHDRGKNPPPGTCPAPDMIQNGIPGKYAVLQHIKNGGNISSYQMEDNLDCADPSDANPVAKLKTFLNNIIEKIFDDKESEKTESQAQEEPNTVSMDTGKEFSAKLSTLLSYFSSENRERYFKGEFLSLLAKKLFPSKDELHLNEFSGLSADCKETGNELVPKGKGDNVPRMPQSSDVIICMNEKRADARQPKGVENVNGVSLSVVARLVETLASSSDAESDSSSSSDYLTSESSAAEDCDRAQTSLVSRRKKAFQHTTVNCQERPGNVFAKTAAAEDSLSSSTSSLVSTSSSLSSSSSSSSRKSPKKTKSKLYQRYYHVFCAGELVKLVQDGIPSAVVLKEYHDHGNWAAILEKKEV